MDYLFWLLRCSLAHFRALAHILFMIILTSGCAYRFTNLHISLPYGVHSIAVESVYDTSRQILPHDALWDAIQRAFATDGHLLVKSRDQADALVRVHVREASVGPTGSTVSDALKEDPDYTDPDKAPIEEFRRLSTAHEHTTHEAVSVTMDVEVVDLKTRRIILARSYSGSRDFDSERAGNIDSRMFFLFYEDALINKFSDISREIARNVVDDMLVQF